jgi:hydrogenase maturation protease
VVQGIYRDLEDAAYVAVSLADDPASDMHTWHGRFLYFYPEEVEPLEPEGRPYAATRDHGCSGVGGGSAPAHVAAGSAALSENPQDVSPRILIAGIGNIFLGDDGFGPEVIRRLASREVPDGTRIVDFGIRGIHLAYELAETTYDSTILVDATPRGGAPGTVYLIEPDPEDLAGGESANLADAHEMNPRAVFNLLRTLGGKLGRVLVVGCEPSPSGADDVGDFGLSAPVAAAVDEAVALIFDVLRGGRDVPCDPR